ncbi:hypothetical protein BGZ73_001072, partial [Actinomortierella ambigua]
MVDSDYIEFCTRFPRIVEACFRLESIQSILDPCHSKEATTGISSSAFNDDNDKTTRHDIKMEQRSLRQLVLRIESDNLDPQMVRCVFRRFPRLERLWIFNMPQNFIYLDLSSGPSGWQSYDNICPRMFTDTQGTPSRPIAAFQSPRWTDDEVAEIISTLPVPLKRIHATNMNSSTIEALATHCNETLEFVSRGVSDLDPENYNLPLQEMPTTIGLLLTRCPKLRRIDCPALELHIHHIMAHPWVCCDHLELLWCRIVGIPRMTTFERFCLEEFYNEQDQNHRSPTKLERRILEKAEIIGQYNEVLRTQQEK